MKKSRFVCTIAVVLMLSCITALGQAAEPLDPFLGAWKLNVARSKYPPGTCPRQMTIEMTRVSDGIHYRSDTTFSDGRSTRSEYTADYGSKEVMVRGSFGILLPVSLKRQDASTVVATYTRGMQVVATSRRVVSEDGRVMTITTVSPDKSGQSVTTVSVYDKVDGVADKR